MGSSWDEGGVRRGEEGGARLGGGGEPGALLRLGRSRTGTCKSKATS